MPRLSYPHLPQNPCDRRRRRNTGAAPQIAPANNAAGVATIQIGSQQMYSPWKRGPLSSVQCSVFDSRSQK